MAVILIVDDEYFIREYAISAVEELGHVTLAAADMKGAIVHLNSIGPIDALITDVSLDAALLGGFELAERARTLRPNLRVLYMTGRALTDATRALFVEGAYFLEKPYSLDQLQNSVEALLAA